MKSSNSFTNKALFTSHLFAAQYFEPLGFYRYGPTNTDIQYLYQSNTDIPFKIDIQLLLISVSEFKTSINSEGICVVIDSD